MVMRVPHRDSFLFLSTCFVSLRLLSSSMNLRLHSSLPGSLSNLIRSRSCYVSQNSDDLLLLVSLGSSKWPDVEAADAICWNFENLYIINVLT